MAEKAKQTQKKKGQAVKRDKANKSPNKDGNNSKVPGVFGDSEPIGGGG